MAIKKPVNPGYSYRTGSCFGSSGSKYDFWLEYKVLEQFTATLESKVDTKIYLQRNDGFAESAYNNLGTNYRRINDYGFNGNIDTRNNARVLLAEKEWIVKHEVNGKKTFNVNAEFFIDAAGLTGGKLNTNIELPVIQVASTIEFNDYVLGDEFNATIKASNSMFTHDVRFYVFNQEVARRNNIPENLAMRFTDEEEENIYNLMANTISTDLKVTITTYDTTGTSLGTNETVKKININPDINKPQLINARFEINHGHGYYGNANIKGRSNIAYDMVTFKAKNGATMSKLRLEMGSKKVEKYYIGDGTDDELDANYINLISPEEDVTEVFLTGIDSRGLETKIGRYVPLSPYIPPKILKLETYRKNGVDTETYLNLEILCWLGEAYGLVSQINNFTYRTSEGNFDKTDEFKDNYEYNSETNILKLTDFPIHKNGTAGGFPVGEEANVVIDIVIGNDGDK